MTQMPGVSIVIPNYNYAQFVASAIHSALAQDHPRCEVIVVDDCSTDRSREVIERYADRVRTVFLPSNRGQVAALNEAWPLVQHEVVIFLDSDDVLEPYAASTIAQNWTPDVAKIQFRMRSIGADGQDLSHIAPKYPLGLSTETLQNQLLREGACYATPGSGNAYSKWMLEKISPIGGLQWMDLLLEVHAPFCGEVRTLNLPLASYRVHGSQWSGYNKLDADHFARYLQLEEDKFAYCSLVFGKLGLAFDPDAARNRSLWYLECLTSISRLSRPGDRWHVAPHKLLARASKAAFYRSPHSVKRRVALFVWITLVALAPRRSAERLVGLRFSMSRPRWLEWVVARIAT